MRCKVVVLGLALTFAVSVGCKQQCFVPECDGDSYLHHMQLPPNLENDPEVAMVPSGADVPQPSTVLEPERPPRYLTLTEAMAMSLENGKVGVENPRLLGVFDDSLTSFNGRNIILSDGIRVLALEPAILGADIESSLSKFDVRWTSSMNWAKTDAPAGGSFIQNFQNGDTATFQSSLLKPLPTGGVAGITFNTAYTFLSNPPIGVTNPAYRPSLQFQFEQPLLQGFGVEINQLRANHPGSLLTPFSNAGRVEGILITRLRFDQQRAEFERHMQYLLLNVELAYWNLYDSYWALYSREQGLRQAYEAWRINKDRLEAGRIPPQDLAQTREQYELFRGQRIAALGQVLENERQLRGLLGMPIEDGTRLIPIDVPTLAFYQPDWSSSLNEALVKRPELVLARQDLKFRQLDLINQKNLLLPDLRFTSTYNLNGFGTHLDGGGNDPNNAFASLASDHFNDWALGLRLDVPLGFRDAHAALRTAKLRLAQSYQSLRDQENRAQSFLAQQYRQLSENYEQIRAQRAQREAAAIALSSRLKQYLAGTIILDVLLKAQQDWADALRAEYDAIVQYNNTLARFQFAKGTMLEHDSVVIAEGPLPHCAQVRAVDHEQERKKAIVAFERARPVVHAPCSYEKGNPGLPELPSLAPASIPSLYEKAPTMHDMAEKQPTTPQTVWNRTNLTPAGVPDYQPAGHVTSAPETHSSSVPGASAPEQTPIRQAALPDGLEQLPALPASGPASTGPVMSPSRAMDSLPLLPSTGPVNSLSSSPGTSPAASVPASRIDKAPPAATPPSRAQLLWRAD